MSEECVSKNIWLVRHPETDWNAEKRYQSCSDRPFSERGKQQLACLIEFFESVEVDAVYSSHRTRTTAIARALIQSKETDPFFAALHELEEIDHGNWEGLTYEEVCAAYPDNYQLRFEKVEENSEHGGECLREVFNRILGLEEKLLSSTYKDIIVVTHATPIRLLLCSALSMPMSRYWQFQIDTASISKIQKVKDGYVVCHINQPCA